MIRLRLQLTASAARELSALDEPVRLTVIADIRTLAESPLGPPPRIERLKGFGAPLHRLRAGTHRVVYRIDGETGTVLRVIDRKDLGRTLRRLRGGTR